MEVLDRRVDRQSLIAIMDNNACCRAKTAREKTSKAFAKAGLSLQEKLALIPQVKNMGIPRLTEDGKLHILAVQYQRGDKFRCPCPSINTNRKKEEPLSRSYCLCCAGHFRFHYQIMLDCQLKLCSVASSPLDSDGQEPCAFLYEILPAPR